MLSFVYNQEITQSYSGRPLNCKAAHAYLMESHCLARTPPGCLRAFATVAAEHSSCKCRFRSSQLKYSHARPHF